METIAIAVLTFVSIVSVIFGTISQLDYKEAAKRLEKLQFTNPHARWLGRTVEAKIYEGSKWELVVVVAVSWQGALAVRPLRDLQTKARLIRKDLVPERVREVEL